MEPTAQLPPLPEPIPEPVVVADGLGVRTRQGRVFAKVDCTIPAGAVAAIAGPAGSGRTSLLLTIAGRMAPSAGTLEVCGESLPGQRAKVRERVAVARIGGVGGVVDLDPDLRVRHGFAERHGAESDFTRSAEILGADLDPDSLVGDLTPFDRALAAVALALLDHPRIVVLDDVHDGLSGVDQKELWSRLRAVAGTGITVVASTIDRGPADGIADVVVDLGRTN